MPRRGRLSTSKTSKGAIYVYIYKRWGGWKYTRVESRNIFYTFNYANDERRNLIFFCSYFIFTRVIHYHLQERKEESTIGKKCNLNLRKSHLSSFKKWRRYRFWKKSPVFPPLFFPTLYSSQFHAFPFTSGFGFTFLNWKLNFLLKLKKRSFWIWKIAGYRRQSSFAIQWIAFSWLLLSLFFCPRFFFSISIIPVSFPPLPFLHGF